MSFLPPEALAHLRGIFVEEAEQLLKEAQEHCAAWTTGAPVPHRIKAVLHGLKGSAGSVELPGLAAAVHDVEERLADPASARPELIGPLLRALRDAAPFAREVEGVPPHALAEVTALLRAAAGEASPPAAVVAPETSTALAPTPSRAPTQAAPRIQVVEHTAVTSAALAQSVRLAAELKRAISELREAGAHADALQRAAVSCEELETLLERMRQSPGQEAVDGLDVEVSAIARRLGKEVRLEVEGAELRCERRVLQLARGSLRHLVRNALDHGLETPEERRRAGKPAQGLLTVRLAVEAGRLRVELSDDGRGFDLPAVRRRLAEQLGDAEVAALSDDEAVRRFALEGGSTREEASDLSGRGVGLSAVARSTRDAGGGFELRTTPGAGTRISFTLPVEAWVAEVLTFTVEGVVVAVPTSAVVYSARLRDGGQALHTPVGEVVSVAGITARRLDLGAVLGLCAPASRPFVVLVQVDEAVLALGVDEIGAVHRVVPRTAPPAVNPEALVTGLVVLPESGAVQLLSPPKLFERAATTRPVRPAVEGGGEGASARATRGDAGPRSSAVSVGGAPATAASAAAAKKAPGRRGLRVLLVEDSAATREVYRLLLESDGHQVRVATDGAAGYAAALAEAPELIVTDVDMPVQDGFWLTRSIRSTPRLAGTTVVLLTSRDDPNSRAEGAASGADAFLVKSTFSPLTLRETLARLGLAGELSAGEGVRRG